MKKKSIQLKCNFNKLNIYRVN